MYVYIVYDVYVAYVYIVYVVYVVHVVYLVYLVQPARERAERPRRGQLARFGTGCYIEMATSYHQPHEYELVSGENWFLAKNGSWPGRL